MHALEAWDAATPAGAATKPAIAELLARARTLVEDDMVRAIHARALTNGHRAVKTAWTDAACPQRFCAAPAAIGDFSCDTHLLSRPSGAFIENEPTTNALQVAAQMPLSRVAVYDGMTLEDWLIDLVGVARIPRTTVVKVKGLLVYAPEAEVMLRTRAYRGVRTTTYAMHATGSFATMGARSGNGLLGFGADDGQMKAFKLEAAVESGDNAPTLASASDPDYEMCPALWGPMGSGITTSSREIIMTVTLFRHGAPLGPPPGLLSPPVYRSLAAAAVSVSGTDVGAALEVPNLKDEVIDAVCVEIFRCFAITGMDASADETDVMCCGNLRMQADVGGNAMNSEAQARADAVLMRLEGKAFCSNGHGPWEYGSKCPECGARCVCT